MSKPPEGLYASLNRDDSYEKFAKEIKSRGVNIVVLNFRNIYPEKGDESFEFLKKVSFDLARNGVSLTVLCPCDHENREKFLRESAKAQGEYCFKTMFYKSRKSDAVDEITKDEILKRIADENEGEKPLLIDQSNQDFQDFIFELSIDIRGRAGSYCDFGNFLSEIENSDIAKTAIAAKSSAPLTGNDLANSRGAPKFG
jgi:hypothetical protein